MEPPEFSPGGLGHTPALHPELHKLCRAEGTLRAAKGKNVYHPYTVWHRDLSHYKSSVFHAV